MAVRPTSSSIFQPMIHSEPIRPAMDRQPTAGHYSSRHYLILPLRGSKYCSLAKVDDLLHESVVLSGRRSSSLVHAIRQPTMSNSKAIRIGSLLFCPACGTLLDLPGDSDEIVCDGCARREPASCKYSVSSRKSHRTHVSSPFQPTKI